VTTPARVQRHRKAEAARRQVTTRGKRVPRPRTPKSPARKRSRYAKSGALSGLSFLLSMGFFAGGSALWAVGACASAAGSAIAWRIEHRRQLAEVKATGRPIGDEPPKPQRTTRRKPVQPVIPPASWLEGDMSEPARPAPRQPKTDDHATRCKAKPPGGPTCRCPDGPNRKGKTKTTTKRASGGARRTK
jgi:hypothetical protein